MRRNAGRGGSLSTKAGVWGDSLDAPLAAGLTSGTSCEAARTGLGCVSRSSTPERVLSNRSEAGDWVWTFALVPENGSTRLISRNRIAMKGAAAGQRLGMLVMEPGSLVMERKMLLGIKQRAERSLRQR
jgi:hypothetical protein